MKIVCIKDYHYYPEFTKTKTEFYEEYKHYIFRKNNVYEILDNRPFVNYTIENENFSRKMLVSTYEIDGLTIYTIETCNQKGLSKGSRTLTPDIFDKHFIHLKEWRDRQIEEILNKD